MNRIAKSIIYLMVFVLLTANFLVQASIVSFSDIKSTDWFYNNVNEAVGKGIVLGYEDGSFRANQEISTAEFIKMVVITLNGGDVEDNGSKNWMDKYYAKAMDMGIVKQWEFLGYNKSIIREDVALICDRAIKMLEPNNSYDKGKLCLW